MKLKNKLITLALGIGLLYGTNATSQDTSQFVKKDTIAHGYYKDIYGLFGLSGTKSVEIIALDTNRNGINENVVKKTVEKKPFGKRTLTYQEWTNFNEHEDSLFDKYEMTVKNFNFFGKEMYSDTEVITDSAEINKNYGLPRFDGKEFKWANN